LFDLLLLMWSAVGAAYGALSATKLYALGFEIKM
jgi:hypothetical protein